MQVDKTVVGKPRKRGRGGRDKGRQGEPSSSGDVGEGEIEMGLLAGYSDAEAHEATLPAPPSVVVDGGGNKTKLSRPYRTPFFDLLRALPPTRWMRPLWRWAPRRPSNRQKENGCKRTFSNGDSELIAASPSPLGSRYTTHSTSATAFGIEDGEALVERYNNVLGDKQWFYAELASFGCSLLVGAMEGVPAARCRPRAVVALLAATLQCGLSLTTVVPLELALQSLLGLCIVPLSIVVTANVFSAASSETDTATGDGEEGGDAAIDVLSIVGNIIGIGLMAVGVVRGAVEMFTSYRNRRHHSILTAATPPAVDHLCSTNRADEAVTNDSATDGGSVPLSSLVCGASAAGIANSDPLNLSFDVGQIADNDTEEEEEDPLALGGPDSAPSALRVSNSNLSSSGDSDNVATHNRYKRRPAAGKRQKRDGTKALGTPQQRTSGLPFPSPPHSFSTMRFAAAVAQSDGGDETKSGGAIDYSSNWRGIRKGVHVGGGGGYDEGPMPPSFEGFKGLGGRRRCSTASSRPRRRKSERAWNGDEW